jgi:hypothetical protein
MICDCNTFNILHKKTWKENVLCLQVRNGSCMTALSKAIICGLDDRGSIHEGGSIFLLATMSRLTVKSTYLLCSEYPVTFFG